MRRGVQEAYLLVDLPCGSYQTPEMAVENARRLLLHRPNGVKLEGGIEQVDVVRALVSQGIEVCGHLGFTPQTLGTKDRVQGRSLEEEKALLRSALALEAGLSLLILELISEPISQMITQHLHIPTIGIGSGRYCDGQVLVVMDLLGVSISQPALCTLSLFKPKLAAVLDAKKSGNRFFDKFLAETLIICMQKNLKYLHCLVQLVRVALFHDERPATSRNQADTLPSSITKQHDPTTRASSLRMGPHR